MVLTGQEDDRIERNGHDQLSTFGLLREHAVQAVQDWVGDLVRQGYLLRGGEYNTLSITDEGRRLLQGEAMPILRAPGRSKTSNAARQRMDDPDSWEGVDDGLFEVLRALRTEQARARGVPPYVVFGDAALRDMARRRPSTTTSFLEVRGVGEKKCDDFGEAFVGAIAAYCGEHDVPLDVAPVARGRRPRPSRDAPSASALAAFPLFESGASVEEVAQEMGRAHSTIHGYLGEYLQARSITDPSPWVDAETTERVTRAFKELDRPDRLKTLHEHLGGEVDYDTLRIVVSCLRVAIASNDDD